MIKKILLIADILVSTDPKTLLRVVVFRLFEKFQFKVGRYLYTNIGMPNTSHFLETESSADLKKYGGIKNVNNPWALKVRRTSRNLISDLFRRGWGGFLEKELPLILRFLVPTVAWFRTPNNLRYQRKFIPEIRLFGSHLQWSSKWQPLGRIGRISQSEAESVE